MCKAGAGRLRWAALDADAVDGAVIHFALVKFAVFGAGRYVALKYFADGWWKTRADTEASGSIMWPSVSWMPI